MTDDDQFDELMRRALAEEADRVEPADSLHEIKSRVSSQRKVAVSRRPWVIAAGAAVVGTAAAISAFTMLGDDARNTGEPPVAGPPATSPATARATSPVTPTPSQATEAPSTVPSDLATAAKRGTPEPMVKGKAVSIYWVGKAPSNVVDDPGVRLYRTFVPVSGRPAYEAVQMLSSGKTDDPDYYSLWREAVPLSVTQSGDLVTVDFKRLPQQKLTAGMANFAVQQLVYTIQGVLGDESQQVRVTEQGRSAGILFGQVDSRQPFSRAQAADVQAKVWITAPTEGQQVRIPFTVDGIAAAFEGSVNWRAVNTKTGQTVQGHTLTKLGQAFSPFAFSPKLAPGLWRIEAYLISPQDGRSTDVDSKSVFIR